MAFAAPSTTSGISWDDHKGELLIVAPKESVVLPKTQYGNEPTPAVRADVLFIAEDGSVSDKYLDTLIFPKVLQSQVKNSIPSGLVLGRLGQGQKKPGQSAPWILSEASAADQKLAEPAGDSYLAASSPAPAPSLGKADSTDDIPF